MLHYTASWAPSRLPTRLRAASIAGALAAAASAPAAADDLRAAYKIDLLAIEHSGTKRTAEPIDLLTFGGDFDLQRLGWAGASASISVNRSNGGGTAPIVGQLQNPSSLEAGDSAVRLFEAWVDQRVGEHADIKAGLIDLNSEFDASEPRALFLDASQGIGPELAGSGVGGPSIYPTTTLGVRGLLVVSDTWTVRTALFNGQAGDPAHRTAFVGVRLDGGALLIAEAKRKAPGGLTFAAGAWRYTASFDKLPRSAGAPLVGDAARASGNGGGYATIEAELPAPLRRGKVQGFVRAGFADPTFNRVSDYLGAGLVWSGALPAQPTDTLGVSLASAGLGAGGRAELRADGGQPRRETLVEATYSAPLRPWISLQPVVTYIDDPGARRSRNTVFVGARLSLAGQIDLGGH